MDSETMVTIIGAGTMGYALALVFAHSGSPVFLTDTNDKALKRGEELIRSALSTLAITQELRRPENDVLTRIKTSTNYRTFAKKCGLVIEAIVEDTEAKRKLYSEIVHHIGDKTIVASNTSYLDVFSLAPDSIQKRMLITHFFNPPYIVPLVEVVGGPMTDAAVIQEVLSFLKRAEMTPILLKKFVRGYIVNRLQRALGREVFHILDEGIAGPVEIDRAVKASLGIRLPILGVVKRFDHAGLDMTLRALQAPSIGLAKEDKVSPSILKLVEQGHLGIKSGKGFFDYSDKPLNEVISERDAKLIRVRKLLRTMSEIE